MEKIEEIEKIMDAYIDGEKTWDEAMADILYVLVEDVDERE